MRKQRLRKLRMINALVLSIALLLPAMALAQTRSAGQIVGIVQDVNSAVIPGAEVKLEEEATGASQTVKSGNDGKFVFLNVQPGTYRVTVSMQGFTTAVHSNIKVDAARTSDVTVSLEAGNIQEKVQVTAGAEVLERSSTTVASTVRGDAIRSLPLNNRDTLDFVMLLPGAQQAGVARQGTFTGLPKGALNITMDGVNVQDNTLKSSFGGGMFTLVRPRIDAIEEVTVKSATAGADAAGEGAVQIQFVTRRGTNNLRGTLFFDHRNEWLNANTWFNNARGLKRPRNLLNVFGGNVGGPIWKDKIFFFFNYEEFRLPQSQPRENIILTQEAAGGVFRYLGTDGVTRTANLLTIARNANFPGAIDSTIAAQLSAINGVRANGAITSFDLFRERYRFEAPAFQLRRFPTLRMDYHIKDNLSWYGTWHYNYFSSFPDTLNSMDPSYPGLEDPGKPGGQYSNRFSLTNTLQWQITSTLTNETRFGLQGAPVQFFPESGPEIYPSLRRVVWPLGLHSPDARPGGVATTSRSLPSSRNAPLYNLQDNVGWAKGKHTFSFGGSFTILRSLDNSYGGAGIPTVQFGVATGDPVSGIFSAASMPGISSTDLTNARALYAMLTGRISSVSGSRNVDDQSLTYKQLSALIQRLEQREYGLYFMDSWRFSPTLTINAGLRWEFQGAVRNTNGIYTSPDLENLFGPSGVGNLFQPGNLPGVANPVIDLRPDNVYNNDYFNPAPSIGLAWNPRFQKGWLKKIFGEDKSVFRTGYSIAYTREGLSNFSGIAGGNPGLTQSITLTPGDPGFTPGGLLLSSVLPAFREFPRGFTFPQPMSDFTFSSNFNTFNPNIRTPYVQSWTLTIQRELNKDTALELRYVGNRGTKLWRSFNNNEVNIFENGFLDEFKRAQRNLTINRAAGVTSFANRNLPGQSPLPIFEAAFGARGGQPALTTAAGFGSGTFITLLDQGQAGGLAASLAGSSTTLCRMVGNQLPACAVRGFAAGGTFPINFFQANPFAAGGAINMLSNGGFSTYNGMQIELRRRMGNGLSFSAHYDWSKSLTDLYADGAGRSYTTLRNGSIDKGPSPWDIRHSFVANWYYELPFGPGRKFNPNIRGLNKVIEGWDLLGITRLQSGRVFKLTSGRATVNQFDSGVILKGITIEELQRSVGVYKRPNSTDIFIAPRNLIGPDGRSNRDLIDVPTEPGVFGSFVYLYGPRFVKADISIIKKTRITERMNVEFWTEFFNAFNNQNFMVGAPGGAATTVSIDSTSFGRTTDFFNDLGNQDPGPRMIQFRIRVNF